MMQRALGAVALAAVLACTPDGVSDGGQQENDAGQQDAGRDAGTRDGGADAGSVDGGHDGGSADSGVDAGPSDAGASDAAVDAGPEWLTRLETLADMESLAGSQGEVKFLAQVDGVTPQAPVLEPCLFQNTTLYPYHLMFLRSFAEHATMTNSQYTAMVLRPATRVWWGGGVQRWVGRQHPISQLGETIVYTIYADSGGTAGLTEANIREVDGRLKSCMPFALQTLAFLPTDTSQVTLARSVEDVLAQDGIAVIIP